MKDVEPDAEAEAEAFGFQARQDNDPRALNPFLMHLRQSPTSQALADAWWRGWDRAEAILKDAAR